MRPLQCDPMALDKYEQRFQEQLQSIREAHRYRPWDDSIPVAYVAARDYSGMLCVCHNVPGGFECATCGDHQPYHEGKCNGCGAELYLRPAWEQYREDLKRREMSLVRSYQMMRYGG